MIITEPMREQFERRMARHIERVNYFAGKLGLSFPDHDADKFLPENRDIQTKFSWSCYINAPLSDEEKRELDEVTLRHITTQRHHPECWLSDVRVLKDFSRFTPTMELECSAMPDEALYEMCCDWCAMAKQLHSSPLVWYSKTVGRRWLFTERQTKLIYDTLMKLSEGEVY